MGQFNQGKNVCLRVTENLACGNNILMQRGKLELELLQIQDDPTLGQLSGVAPWLWKKGLSSATRHIQEVAGDS